MDYEKIVQGTINQVQAKLKISSEKKKAKASPSAYYEVWKCAFKERYPKQQVLPLTQKDLSVIKNFIKNVSPDFDYRHYVEFCVAEWNLYITKTSVSFYKALPPVPSLSVILSSNLFPILSGLLSIYDSGGQFSGEKPSSATSLADASKKGSTVPKNDDIAQLKQRIKRIVEQHDRELSYWKARASAAERALEEVNKKYIPESENNAGNSRLFRGKVIPSWDSGEL